MALIQEILVIITFILALLYLVTKFIWKPTFLHKTKPKAACGTTDCGCH